MDGAAGWRIIKTAGKVAEMRENMANNGSRAERRMPVLFVGHGNPMNALLDTPFTRKLRTLGERFNRPRAILCVSAHWLSEGIWITHMEQPRTIHDFYGFPEELFAVRYAAPGSPEIAEEISAAVATPKINFDDEIWGLDHGTWSILKHIYPRADLPVLQLSIYLGRGADYHYQLGRRLRPLRERGILIVGSGNLVHNLGRLRWEEGAEPYDWAVEFDEWVKERLAAGDHGALLDVETYPPSGKLSIPTPDHWYPLFYVLGASHEGEELSFEYEGIDNGSISMRTLSLG